MNAEVTEKLEAAIILSDKMDGRDNIFTIRTNLSLLLLWRVWDVAVLLLLSSLGGILQRPPDRTLSVFVGIVSGLTKESMTFLSAPC